MNSALRPDYAKAAATIALVHMGPDGELLTDLAKYAFRELGTMRSTPELLSLLDELRREIEEGE